MSYAKVYKHTTSSGMQDSDNYWNAVNVIEGKVTEKRNGEYTASFSVPLGKVGSIDPMDWIQLHRRVRIKPNPYDREQDFIITDVSSDGSVLDVTADHEWYMLEYMPCIMASTYINPSQIMRNLLAGMSKKYNPIGNQYVFEAVLNGTIESGKTYTTSDVMNVKELLLDVADYYQAELKIDRHNITMYYPTRSEQVNTNECPVVAYGYNVMDISYEHSSDDTYSGVFPYWYSEGTVMLPTNASYNHNAIGFGKWQITNVTREYEEGTKPTAAQLNTRSTDMLGTVTDTGKRSISAKVAVDPNDKILNSLKLCDRVRLIHGPLHIDELSQVVGYTYDFVNDRYTEIQIGNEFSLEKTLYEQEKRATTYTKEVSSGDAIKLTLTRNGNYVTVSSRGSTTPTATSKEYWILPRGYRPARTVLAGCRDTSVTNSGTKYTIYPTGRIVMVCEAVVKADRTWTVGFTTNDPYPYKGNK